MYKENINSNIKFCKKCVISNQRPSSSVEFKNINQKKKYIDFDENGICSACRFAEEKKLINWSEREQKLISLLDKYRSSDSSYDCIVPSSGGKDSSFTAHLLKYKYGMNPLTVTWAPGMYTDVGLNNMQSLINVGGIDNLLYSPNGKLHRLLTKLAFLNLGHPLQPFIHGQKIIGPRLAMNFRIPLIVYGENQAEYGNNIDENSKYEMDTSFFTLNDYSEMRLGGLNIEEIINKYNFKIKDFSAYMPLSQQEVQNNKLSMIYLGYFVRWDPQECYYYAAENTGFQPAPERSSGTYSKYTEIDDKIIPFHFYTLLLKFGIGRATYDAAQEIRNNKITREEGVLLVKKYDQEFPEKFLQDFLNYTDLSKSEFLTAIEKFRNQNLWRKDNDGTWKLKNPIWNGL
jgi:N-acetyl sugar amidotransferase